MTNVTDWNYKTHTHTKQKILKIETNLNKWGWSSQLLPVDALLPISASEEQAQDGEQEQPAAAGHRTGCPPSVTVA